MARDLNGGFETLGDKVKAIVAKDLGLESRKFSRVLERIGKQKSVRRLTKRIEDGRRSNDFSSQDVGLIDCLFFGQCDGITLIGCRRLDDPKL